MLGELREDAGIHHTCWEGKSKKATRRVGKSGWGRYSIVNGTGREPPANTIVKSGGPSGGGHGGMLGPRPLRSPCSGREEGFGLRPG
jgi:hypothetical protein